MGGIDASALNQNFTVKGIVDGAHYLVQVSEMATSGTSGGGAAVIGNALEPRYQTWLYNENLVLSNPFAATNGSGTVTVTDVNADLYAKVGAQVTFGGAAGFAGIDLATHGLIRLPAAERHGMLFVRPKPVQPGESVEIDVDSSLGPLAADLAALRLETYPMFSADRVAPRINWKFAIDTFLEGYHIPHLHR